MVNILGFGLSVKAEYGKTNKQDWDFYLTY